MQAPPLVSVLLPVWNGERFLRAAVESILTQTFVDFEFLVVDDGSTDGTSRMLEEYRGDDRLRVIRNPENRGLIASLNLGILEARGRYVARMDADDTSHPQRLERQVSFMEANPEVVGLGTGAQVIDERGRPFRRSLFPEKDAVLRWSLCFYSPIVHPSVILRRDALLASGGFDPKFIHAEDYDLFDRLRRLGRLANLPNVLYDFRIYDRQISRPEYWPNAIEISRRVIDSYIGDCSVDADLVTLLAGRRAKGSNGGRRDVIRLFDRLHKAFQRVERPSREDDAKIASEAALRLLSIGLKGEAWRAADRILFLAAALRWDRLVLARAMQNALKLHPISMIFRRLWKTGRSLRRSGGPRAIASGHKQGFPSPAAFPQATEGKQAKRLKW